MTVRKASYTVHEFQPGARGYETIVALHRIVSPDRRAETVKEMRREDASWPEGYLFKRFVVVAEGGKRSPSGSATKHIGWSSRARFTCTLTSTPSIRSRIFCRYYMKQCAVFLNARRETYRACQAAPERTTQPECISCWVGDSGRRCARRRRLCASPPSTRRHLRRIRERLAQGKIDVFTLAQLYELDPEWKCKLRDLRWPIVQDVPSPEPFTKPTLAEFDEMIVQDPEWDEEAFFVALAADGSYVGMSNLWRKEPNGKRFGAGLTGVVRRYRRRGIVRTIQYAQSVGAETIVASNEENNPMYALNLKLGFEPNASMDQLL